MSLDNSGAFVTTFLFYVTTFLFFTVPQNKKKQNYYKTITKIANEKKNKRIGKRFGRCTFHEEGGGLRSHAAVAGLLVSARRARGRQVTHLSLHFDGVRVNTERVYLEHKTVEAFNESMKEYIAEESGIVLNP